MANARVFIISETPEAWDLLRAALTQASVEVGERLEGCQLIILEAATLEGVAVHWHALRDGVAHLAENHVGDLFMPILIVSPSSETRAAFLERGADAALEYPFDNNQLLAQVAALLRLKIRNDSFGSKADELLRVQRRMQESFQRLDLELDLARRIQQSFLPASMPQAPGVRFAVHFQPCGRVGGDCHDVFRLDEAHAGFYLADTMGHGVAASLQAIYLERGVRSKEIVGNTYRLLPPDEVLRSLNRDLLGLGLAEQPFVTMLYGLFDSRDGTLRYARAGLPRPIYLPGQGEAEVWPSTGPLLGVFEAEFTTHTHQLKPGDKLLFHTDGAEVGRSVPLLDATLRLRDQPITELVAALGAELRGDGSARDDITLLGLEVTTGAEHPDGRTR